MTHVGSKDAGVGVGVRSWEAKELVLGGNSRATPANVDLLTGRVEFRFTFLGGQMKGDDLVSNQVLSWSEVIRKIGGVNAPIHFVCA